MLLHCVLKKGKIWKLTKEHILVFLLFLKKYFFFMSLTLCSKKKSFIKLHTFRADFSESRRHCVLLLFVIHLLSSASHGTRSPSRASRSSWLLDKLNILNIIPPKLLTSVSGSISTSTNSSLRLCTQHWEQVELLKV